MASKYTKFGEFLSKKQSMDLKDSLAGKDYSGPLAVKPPQEPGQEGNPLPYKPSEDDEGQRVAHDDNPKQGLGYEATPGMKPESPGKAVDAKPKQLPKPRKMTSEEFVNGTKGMSNAQFIEYLLENHEIGNLPTVSDLFGNEFTPDPSQSIQYVSALLSASPTYMGKFVREMKRMGSMEKVLAEMFGHAEAYHHIIDHLEDEDHGDERCATLGRMMNDRYTSAIDVFDFGESVGPGIDQLMGAMPSPTKKAQGGPMGGGSGPDDTPDANYTKKGPPQGGPMGGGFGPGPQGPPAGPGGVMGGQAQPQFAGQPPLMPPKKMKAEGDMKFKGRNAGLSLINELSGYDHFKKHMMDRCKDGNC